MTRLIEHIPHAQHLLRLQHAAVMAVADTMSTDDKWVWSTGMGKRALFVTLVANAERFEAY